MSEKFFNDSEFKNPLKSEHLNEGIKPIIACVDNYNSLGDLDHKLEYFLNNDRYFKNTQKKENVDYFEEDPQELEERNFKSGGYESYVISGIDSADKFSQSLRNCTGVVVTGKDKETGEDISFLTHQDPDFFTKDGIEEFTNDFYSRLNEMKERCEPGTIDAVIAGGNYTRSINSESNYRNSISLLSKEISDVFGFEPVVIAGPKTSNGDDHLFYSNKERRLHIMRLTDYRVPSESYLPKDYAVQEKKWQEEALEGEVKS